MASRNNRSHRANVVPAQLPPGQTHEQQQVKARLFCGPKVPFNSVFPGSERVGKAERFRQECCINAVYHWWMSDEQQGDNLLGWSRSLSRTQIDHQPRNRRIQFRGCCPANTEAPNAAPESIGHRPWASPIRRLNLHQKPSVRTVPPML